MCVIDKGIEARQYGKAIKSLEDKVECRRIQRACGPAVVYVDEARPCQAKASMLIGVGGGSSMDPAKAIAILIQNPGKAKDYILPKPEYYDTKTPVILVPTTAGTGSEVTAVCIISRPELGAKWSAFVNTNYAIVDPELTLSLPKRETAHTGLDALAHATEAMTSVDANPHAMLSVKLPSAKCKISHKSVQLTDNTRRVSEMMHAPISRCSR
jgi:alcohol dehydrogenase class IV